MYPKTTKSWGLVVPGRPPTRSEGHAQSYVRVGPESSQRLKLFDNGTSLLFGPDDLVDEFTADHPFVNQIAEIDAAIRDCLSVSRRYQVNDNDNDDDNNDNRAYNNFRTTSTPSINSNRSGLSVQLESGSYFQLPSKSASVGTLFPVYSQVNQSDVPGESHPGYSPDTRFGVLNTLGGGGDGDGSGGEDVHDMRRDPDMERDYHAQEYDETLRQEQHVLTADFQQNMQAVQASQNFAVQRPQRPQRPHRRGRRHPRQRPSTATQEESLDNQEVTRIPNGHQVQSQSHPQETIQGHFQVQYGRQPSGQHAASFNQSVRNGFVHIQDLLRGEDGQRAVHDQNEHHGSHTLQEAEFQDRHLRDGARRDQDNGFNGYQSYLQQTQRAIQQNFPPEQYREQFLMNPGMLPSMGDNDFADVAFREGARITENAKIAGMGEGFVGPITPQYGAMQQFQTPAEIAEQFRQGVNRFYNENRLLRTSQNGLTLRDRFIQEAGPTTLRELFHQEEALNRLSIRDQRFARPHCSMVRQATHQLADHLDDLNEEPADQDFGMRGDTMNRELTLNIQPPTPSILAAMVHHRGLEQRLPQECLQRMSLGSHPAPLSRSGIEGTLLNQSFDPDHSIQTRSTNSSNQSSVMSSDDGVQRGRNGQRGISSARSNAADERRASNSIAESRQLAQLNSSVMGDSGPLSRTPSPMAPRNRRLFDYSRCSSPGTGRFLGGQGGNRSSSAGYMG